MIFPQETELDAPKVSQETGRVPIVKLGSVSPEDLLGSDPASVDIAQARKHITGLTVLITGGGA